MSKEMNEEMKGDKKIYRGVRDISSTCYLGGELINSLLRTRVQWIRWVLAVATSGDSCDIIHQGFDLFVIRLDLPSLDYIIPAEYAELIAHSEYIGSFLLIVEPIGSFPTESLVLLLLLQAKLKPVVAQTHILVVLLTLVAKVHNILLEWFHFPIGMGITERCCPLRW